MAPARTPDVGAFMDNLGALRAMLGPSVASRMQAHGEDQEARWDAGERGPTPLTEDRVWLADDVAGALLGPIGMAGVIKAYHGSPHRFSKFSMDKIGTGEGSQAFGHGLYFSEIEDVARSYSMLANGFLNDSTVGAARRVFNDAGGDVAKAKSQLQNMMDEARQAGDINSFSNYRDAIGNLEVLVERNFKPGNFYTTRLDVEPEDLLDWDAPLSQQSEKVRAAVDSALSEWRKQAASAETASGSRVAKANAEYLLSDDIKVGDLYRMLEREGKPWARSAADVSAALREAGIPGIRYLDQGSRASGEGTRNFVIFDDSLISIESID